MSANERPGVYSSYEVYSSVSGRANGGVVGLAAVSGTGKVGEVTTVTSYAQAVAAFGKDSSMASLCRIILANGAARVVATPVKLGTAAPTTAEYTAAFGVLMTESLVSYMVCDSQAAAVHAAMKAAIAGGGENCKYRVGFVEGDGTAAVLTAAAQAINSERMVFVGNCERDGVPGAVAAAVAGFTAGETDPALPLNGGILKELGELKLSFSESDVRLLIQGGVCPVETVSGESSIVRAVTSRTTTSGAADSTWRELTTVLIVDDVIPTVRAALRAKFARAKNTAQTRGAIRTQVMIELENKLKAEIIDSYGGITVAADASDPTICNVSFEFTVAHGLNSVELVAYITV